MANTIKLKKSSVAAKVPLTTDLDYGELAINYTDGNLFFKSASNTVTTIASTQFVSVTGNVTGNYFIGNGSLLTGIVATGGSSIDNGTSNVKVAPSANVTTTVNANLISTVHAGGMAVTGAVSATGAITAGAFSNISGGNIDTAGTVSATGTITGGNLATGGTISATGDITTAGVVNSASVSTSGNIRTAGTISATGNITGGNIAGIIRPTAGNTTAGIIFPNDPGGGAGDAASIKYYAVSGETARLELSVTNDYDDTIYLNASGGTSVNGTLWAGAMSATGNVTGNYFIGNGSLLTGISGGTSNTIVNGTSNVFVAASANVTTAVTGNVVVTVHAGGQNVAGAVSATGAITAGAFSNISGGNIDTAGTISATGTITGGNLSTTGNVSGFSLIGSVISANGNITGANVNTGGAVSAAGTITGGNLELLAVKGVGGAANVYGLTAQTTVSAAGNITGGNVITSGLVSAATLTTSGNVLVGGDFIVNGNTTYINITDLNVEDPIIGLGRGPNNTPLIADDGKDRGEQLWYYDTAERSAFIGWDDSAAKLIAAADVSIANEIVTVNSYGTFVAGWIEGATVSATGTITGGNIATAGTVSATGNITGGNIATAGTLSANGVVIALGNINAGTGTISGSNLQLLAVKGVGGTANVYNLTAETTVSATGTITGGNVSAIGNVTATGLISASGNVTGGNVFATGIGIISAPGNVTGGNITTTGNVTGGNVLATGIGIISAPGNVTGGNITTLGNVSGGNIILSGSIIDSGDLILTSSAINANVALTPTGTGTVVINKNITNGQANGVGNIGSSLGYFNTVFAKATSAQYADLAELYRADAVYEAGTVMVIGGRQEVTQSTKSHTSAVAGVVSANPAYTMNAGLSSKYATPVAMIGRVPCRVVAPVAKGDLLVSSNVPGAAQRLDPTQYQPGCVIGKALQNYRDEGIGTIEILVGRL